MSDVNVAEIVVWELVLNIFTTKEALLIYDELMTQSNV